MANLGKVLVSFIGFLARGNAQVPYIDFEADKKSAKIHYIEVLRQDGARRKISSAIIKHCLEVGLVRAKHAIASNGEKISTLELAVEGNLALRRWHADPECAFQDQHRVLKCKTDPDLGAMKVNLHESPLSAMARLKGKGGVAFLDGYHIEAGERLRVDFTRGQMQPSLGQNWSVVQVSRQVGGQGGAADIAQSALSARMRVNKALKAVGPELSGVLLDVCCFLKGLSEVEHARQWPARSAKLMLRTALAALARHYGIAPNTTQSCDPAYSQATLK